MIVDWPFPRDLKGDLNIATAGDLTGGRSIAIDSPFER
jgi:hypothetical protein